MTNRTAPATWARSASGALLAAMLLLSAACTDEGDASTAVERSGESSPTEAEPDDIRLTPPGDPAQSVDRDDVDAALAQIPAEAEALLEESGLPGMAVTVVFEDEVVYAEGFGVKEADTDEPVGADTVFQLASVSKPIGATVVAGLVGNGDVAWEDPVVEHLPGFALTEPAVTEMVTIGDFFSHRSGLPEHAGDLLEDIGFDRGAILERLRLEPLAPFRTTYAYTNFGLTAGAEAAAGAAGMTWEEATEEVLFGPAAMDDTSATLSDFLAASDRAIPHERDDEGNWVPLQQRDPDPQSPAGGVSSTATDMGTWMRIQLNEGRLGAEQIVDSDALLEMHTPQSLSNPPRSPSARSAFYGFGLGIGSRDDGFTSWSHSGAFVLGTATRVSMIPGQQLGVSVITNGQPAGVPEAMAEIVLDLVVSGEVTRDWFDLFGPQLEGLYEPSTPTDWSEVPEDPAAPAENGTYVGIYDNDYYGPLEVIESGDELTMILGPDEMEFPLTHFDGDIFLFTPPGENALGATGVEFTVEGDSATAVTSEFYDATGLGTWTVADR